MIDTHAHLNFPEFSGKIDQVVREAQEAGLRGIIIASSNIEDSKEAVELAERYSGFLWASVGIHPQKTDPENRDPINDQLNQLEEIIKEGEKLVVAIGEVGFDFGEPPPDEEERSREEQEELFLGQIDLALRHHLPLIVHAREANDEAIEIIKRQGKEELRGVFHCYSGGKKRIQRVLDLPGAWYFGVDGNLTYDQGLQNVVSLIPKEKLLLETDAPFLAPEPYRGQTSTPAYLPLIAETVAKIWQKNLDFVAGQTLKNTKRLFPV